MSPLRKVPVVMMVACAWMARPSRSLRPVTRGRPSSGCTVSSWNSRSTTSACLMWRFGSFSRRRRMATRYCALSHWARGLQTAGPREVLRRRNWMPTESATSPMMPPRASISRTRWPLAMPPMAGLQDIWAMRSRFRVKSAVRRPIRAEATAASQPACPAPTMTTSYCSV